MSNVDSDKMADGKAEQPDFAMKSPAPSPYPYRDTPAPSLESPAPS